MTPDHLPVGGVVDDSTEARHTHQRLRNTLRLNSFTSLTGGLTAVTVPGPLDEVLGTGHPGIVRLVGAGLVLFALAVVAVAGRSSPRLRAGAEIIIVADGVWVVASIAGIVIGWFDGPGAVVVAAVAAMVATFATLQTRHLRTARRAARRLPDGRIDERPTTEVVHAERRLAGNVTDAWAVITDHELYGWLAPNLSRVQAGTENGPGLHRTCTNRSGKDWSETCTLWDDQRRFDVAVDTTNYPYPLQEMRGSWSVEPDGETHVIVGMDFRFRPRTGLKGAVFAPVMHALFPVVLRRILTGWEAALADRHDRSPENGRRFTTPSDFRKDVTETK